MFKKLFSFFLIGLIVFSSVPAYALNFDTDAAYQECLDLYPFFLDKIKAEGTSDAKIRKFMDSVKDYLLTVEEPITEENLDLHMLDAVNYAFYLVKNISVRNALTHAFPDAVNATLAGHIPQDFMPIYNTVRRFILGDTTPVCVVYTTATKDEISVDCITTTGFEEDDLVFVGFYSNDSALLHSESYDGEAISYKSQDLSHMKAICLKKDSLQPICQADFMEIPE